MQVVVSKVSRQTGVNSDIRYGSLLEVDAIRQEKKWIQATNLNCVSKSVV